MAILELEEDNCRIKITNRQHRFGTIVRMQKLSKSTKSIKILKQEKL